MGTKYTLNVKNESVASGSICVYQTMPDQDDDIFSLAWFSKACNPNSKVKFAWELEYCASWSESGVLKPGVTFEASEVIKADPSNPSKNAFILTRENDAYTFEQSDFAVKKGCITIACDSKIPNKKASIGVGMSGKTAFATNALANTDFTFIPKVKYWIGFGKFEEGQVMDLSRMNHVAEIKFAPNVYNVDVTLDENNEWVIQ